MCMISSMRNALQAKQYSQVISYFTNHGVSHHAEDTMKWAVLYNAVPVVRELAYFGVSLVEHEVPDEMADVIFGDPDDAVALLTKESFPTLIDFLVRRQLEYCTDNMEKFHNSEDFLKPYYLQAMML